MQPDLPGRPRFFTASARRLNPGIPVQIVHRTISPADLAPTVAAYLGVKPPSGCTGRTIEELLRRRE